jgi:hypothetical protein
MLRLLKHLAQLLCSAAMLAQSPSSDVSMGVYPFLEGNMDARINEVVNNCVTNGIDTVYVSVFRTTGPSTGDLWITDSAGNWNAAWGAVRPTGYGIHLPNLITACHAANLRVVAILKCFDTTVQPTNTAHKAYLLDVIRYLTGSYLADGRPVYDLDGIALDYIRFVGSTTGNDPTQVTNFLANVRSTIGPMSLHCYLIANRFDFDGGTYNGQFVSYATVINGFASQYGQHWEQMARYVDVLMPMAYTADGSIYNTFALHQAYVRQCATYARTACQNAGVPQRRVVPTIRTYSDTSETCTPTTIDASITGALLGGGDGYQSFRYGTILSQPTWWQKFALYAVPGQNWPIPAVTTTVTKVSLSSDPSASRDADQSAANLQARFDYNLDNTFDTAWLPLATTAGLAHAPGTARMAMQVRDAQGHVSTTTRRYTAGPVLTLSQPFFSANAGGSVSIALDAGPAAAGKTYLLLASISGSAPGFVWQPGYPVPLNVDWVTQGLANDPANPFLQNGLGSLDINGRATATFQAPAGLLSPLFGVTLTWSAIAAGFSASGLEPAFAAEARILPIL